ncbi:MAG: hypothetical protein LH654_09505 [Thermoleophilia bacterium]|nr:hypothetical protein [Thermoleophilia bacterium]
MTAAQLHTLTRPASDEQRRNRFVQARFEALAEWGIPTADALAIADATDVNILEAVELLRHGCPSDLVLGILG